MTSSFLDYYMNDVKRPKKNKLCKRVSDFCLVKSLGAIENQKFLCYFYVFQWEIFIETANESLKSIKI